MTSSANTGVPVLETPRLRLRPYRADDVEAMFALYSDPRVMRYWSFPPWVEMAQARIYLDKVTTGMDSGEIFPWAIAECASDRLIVPRLRAAAFTPRLGYLRPAHAVFHNRASAFS